MLKQSILNYSEQLSTKCECGSQKVVKLSVSIECKESGCETGSVKELYEMGPGQQLVIFINGSKGFSTTDLLAGVQHANSTMSRKQRRR